MEFRLLGTLEVCRDGAALTLGGPRQRAVLAALALRANQTVGIDYLTAAAWETAPASAGSNIRTYMLKLRHVLGEPEADRIRTEAGGYRLLVGAGELDVVVFDELAGQAEIELRSGKFAAAIDTFDQALGLWRGQPLEGLTGGVELRAESVRLVERQLAVMDLRVQAWLGAGQYGAAIAELRGLIVRHPLRENLWARLMQALHAAGRLAEALDTYHQVRRLLIDELGVEPGTELRRAQELIMADDATHGTNTTGTPNAADSTNTDGDAGSGDCVDVPDNADSVGRVDSADPADRVVGDSVPVGLVAWRQLPMDIAEFVGRDREMAQLSQLAHLGTESGAPGCAVRVVAVCGMAGVGKTRFAVHAAHQIVGAGCFDEIQLCVDLAGFAPDRQPAEPAVVLETFLRMLGVPGQLIPSGLDGRAALYRDRLHGRRALILLDNAATEEQVRPLLPGGGTALVLITSRRSLAGLDGVRPLPLDVFSTETGLAMIAGIIGAQRVSAELAAARLIAQLCGHLPIALALTARRLQNRPMWTIEYLVGRLAAADHRLGQLAVGDRAVRSAFALSYYNLPVDQRRMFRLLALHPGADATAQSAAALVGCAPERAEHLLEALLDEHLLQQAETGRYRCHDLLRSYAGERVLAEHTSAQRSAALDRLLNWYLYAAAAAERLIDPQRNQVRLAGICPPAQLPGFADRDAAVAWFAAEQANLLAAVRAAATSGRDLLTCLLPAAIYAYAALRCHRDVLLSTHWLAVAAARRLPDPAAEASTLNRLGVVYGDLQRFPEALACCARALAIQRLIADRRGVAWTLNNLGVVHTDLHEYPPAVACFREAYELFVEVGDLRGAGLALGNAGDTYRKLGRFTVAADELARALAIQRRERDLPGQRYTYYALGDFHQDRGQYGSAIRSYRQALKINAMLGDRWGDAWVLDRLSGTLLAAGHPHAALGCLRKALTIYQQLDDPRVAEVREHIAEIAGQLSSPAPAGKDR